MDKDHYDPSSTYLHSDAETGQNPLSHYTTNLWLALLGGDDVRHAADAATGALELNCAFVEARIELLEP